MGPKNQTAIILSDCGEVISALSYEDVQNNQNLVSDFVSKHLTEKHLCVGLKMTHNIYIPSIVLSLQELQHAFIFLPTEGNESQSIITDLGLVWVLSFTSSDKCEATLALNGHKLILEKHLSQKKKYENIFYVIRTSGTTGQNKFVRVGKHCIESNVKSLSKIFDVKSTDTIFFGTPLTFDPSMIELLLALHNNACLLITSPNNHVNPARLHQTLFHPQNGVSVLQIVPSLFQRWSQTQIESILVNPRLRVLAFGGECFPRSVLEYKRSDGLKMFNLYGITEVSCWATACETTGEELDEVALGHALEDTVVEVRDEKGRKVTNGEGEIYIGSENRMCFVDDESVHLQKVIFRATGDMACVNERGLFYKGRKNDVFKRLGHKLHLSKIEEMIKNETGLDSKCVWCRTQSKLLAFFVIGSFDKNTKDKILDKVKIKMLHTLPRHCFPDYVDIVRKCPITSHGKTDKKALESLFLHRNRPDKRSVIDTFTSLICQYFGFDLNQLSIIQKNTFFEIGGNSILAVQLLNEFRDELGGECPPDLLTALFEKDLKACFDSARLVTLAPSRKRPQTPKTDTNCVLKKSKNEVALTIAWKHNLEACVDSSPLVFHHKSRALVAVGSFSHIFAVLDTCTGEKVAKFVLPDVVEGQPCLSPCGNFLYVGCFDGKMYCLDFTSNEVKWSYATAERIKCKPALCRESTAIVFGSYDKQVHCVAILDGSPVWTTLVSESIVSAPLVQNSKIYIATICGTCLCLSETTGTVLWTYKSPSPIFGAPCTLSESILWPNVHGNIISLSTEGHKNWNCECQGHLYSSLVRYKNSAIFGCHDRNLYALRVEDGVPKTEVIAGLGDILTTPCICEDRVVVAGNSGHLFVVDLEGGLMGRLRLPGQIFSSVVTFEGKMFVGCRDNNLYCVVTNKT